MSTPAARIRQMRFMASLSARKFARSFSANVARPWRSYTDVLARGGWRSVLLKSVTAAAVSGGGDILCQKLIAPSHHDAEEGTEGREVTAKRRGEGDIDWGRVGNFVAIATAFTPMGHAWYKFLATSIPGAGMRVAFKRMLLDQLFYSPMCLGLYFGLLGAAENKGLERVTRQLRNDLPDTILKSWMVWGPVQMCNFGYVPVHLQVLCTNVVGLFWNSYVSYITHKAPVRAEVEEVAHKGAKIVIMSSEREGGDTRGGMSM